MASKRRVKAEVDLDSLVSSGAEGAYEALQLYRSRAIRHKSKDNILEAINAAAHGAKQLISKGYVNAGAELSNLVVEFIAEGNLEINPALRTVLFDIDAAFPSTHPLRVEFLKAAVKVSIATGQRELGDAILHLRLANCLWEQQDKNAIYHFVLSEEPEVLAQKIGHAETILQRDRNLTLAVLHFLALENLRDANELFRALKRIEKAKEVPFDTELVTFVDYLLQTSRRDAGPLFKSLVNAYAPHLGFDETVETLLMGPIAQRLFNIQPKSNPMMSILQNFLS